MSRAFILVLDSVGVGSAPDAERYGDIGANTLGHIARACRQGRGDKAGLRAGPLRLPNLARLGFAAAAQSPDLEPAATIEAAYGTASEQSAGKDTPSDHWEIAGLPVPFAWGLFPRTQPCFPPDPVAALVARCGLTGVLGEHHASGTEIISELGEEHIRTGKPICYTSADSRPTTAATRPGPALTTPARSCRCCGSVPGSCRAISVTVAASPTWVRRWPAILVSLRSPTAKPAWYETSAGNARRADLTFATHRAASP
jgi:phosphopentomutase